MSDKPNYYECKYRGTIPGDAHSCYNHLLASQARGLVAMLRDQSDDAAIQLGITANPHGIRRGWFYWPANFDPAWLLTCDGFTPVQSPPVSSPS